MELASSDETASKELLTLMNDLHKKLDAHGKVLAERLGVSPEVLEHVAERKENFTASQLAWVDKARKSIETAGKRLESKKGKIQDIDLQTDKSKKPGSGGKKRVRKSDWLKS